MYELVLFEGKRVRLNKLTSALQAEQINKLSTQRLISVQDKRYLAAYPFLLASIQTEAVKKNPDVVLISHAIYAWMPTQIHFRVDQLENATQVIRKAIDTKDKVTESDVDVLANAFGATRGNSKVAASKILHFIQPEHFPMWDSNVKKTWGKNTNFNYIDYKNTVHAIAQENEGATAIASIKQTLNSEGFTYPISDVRAIELILFLANKK